MANNDKTVHHIHVEIPMELWRDFKRIVPESGITSLIVKRLLQAYVNAVQDEKTTIEIAKLII